MARRVVWYKPDHESFGRFILSEQVRRPVALIAGEIAKLAQSTAPRSDGLGPHMADQYRVNVNAGTLRVGGNVRVKVEVYNEIRHAAAVEFGSRRNQAHHTLRLAGSMFGDLDSKEERPSA